MIRALNEAGIDANDYALEYCRQVAKPPRERFFGELIDQLEDRIRDEELINKNVLEQMKWARYEEWSTIEELRHCSANLLVEWLEGYGIAESQIIKLSDMVESEDWDLELETLVILNNLEHGDTYNYSDPSGVVRFQKVK